MQTHIHGELSKICGPLMTLGETPSVSFEQEDDQVIQFSFRADNEHDSYTIYRVQRREIEGVESANEIVGQDTYFNWRCP